MGRACAAKAGRAGIAKTRQAVVCEMRRTAVPSAWRVAILAQLKEECLMTRGPRTSISTPPNAAMISSRIICDGSLPCPGGACLRRTSPTKAAASTATVRGCRRILAHTRISIYWNPGIKAFSLCSPSCFFRLAGDRVVEEDDVGGAPDGVGKKAARLAGHDDFEEFRAGSQLGDELLFRIDRQRLHDGQVTEDFEDVPFRRGERRIHADAAELQKRIRLIEMPGDVGAKSHGALETLVNLDWC